MSPVFQKILVSLIVSITPGPKKSLRIAARMTGANYFEMRSIVKRESWFQSVGVHENDVKRFVCSPKAKKRGCKDAYDKAVDVGWLHPKTCVYHRKNQGGWYVWGIAGLSAPYNLKWLEPYGIDCAPPWVLGIPLVSAFAAAAKHNAKCWRRVKVGPRKYIRMINPRGANGWCR